MIVIVRFSYYKAVTPSCYIIEFTPEEWREFFLLEDNNKRRNYVHNFLHLENSCKRKEFWWIPVDEYCGISIKPNAKIYRSATAPS